MKIFLHYGAVTIVIVTLLLFGYAVSSATAYENVSFSKTKRMLPRVYSGREEPTFYCGCDFSGTRPDLASCDYIPRRNRHRAERIEWEHVVPASMFGHFFTEWTEGDPSCVKRNGRHYKGRRCAGKANALFRRMEGDPVNLLPSIGEVNGDRSDKPYGIVEGEPRRYGACDFETGGGVAEPRESIRGDIARIYFYFWHKYGKPNHFNFFTEETIQTMLKWNKDDPVDETERRRNQRIKAVFGNEYNNPYVEN